MKVITTTRGTTTPASGARASRRGTADGPAERPLRRRSGQRLGRRLGWLAFALVLALALYQGFLYTQSSTSAAAAPIGDYAELLSARSGTPGLTGQAYLIGNEREPLDVSILAALGDLAPGDSLVVRAGHYELDEGELVWPADVSGSETAPVRLLAEKAGAVTVTGSKLIRIEASHLHIAGFHFLELQEAIRLGGQDNLFVNNVFERSAGGLRLYTSNSEVTGNLWTGSLGVSLIHAQPSIDCGQKCVYFQYNRIHGNTWKDIEKTKPNGLEAIMLGYGNAPFPDTYDNALHATVDNNTFINVRGDAEVISVKSDRNVISGNCLVDNGMGALVIRMGDENLIASNRSLGSSGAAMRISGARNVVAGNHFESLNERVAAVDLHSAERKENGLFSYLAARDNQILGNRFQGYNFIARDYSTTEDIETFSAGNLIKSNIFATEAARRPGLRLDTTRTQDEFLESNTVSANRVEAVSTTPLPDCRT